MVEAGIHSFIQSTRRYSSNYYMVAAGSYIGIKERHTPPLLDLLKDSLAWVAIIVIKEACHTIWAFHLFRLIPPNWSNNEWQTYRGTGQMGLHSVSKCYTWFPGVWCWPSQAAIRFINNACSLAHTGLLAYGSLLQTHGTPWRNPFLTA